MNEMQLMSLDTLLTNYKVSKESEYKQVSLGMQMLTTALYAQLAQAISSIVVMRSPSALLDKDHTEQPLTLLSSIGVHGNAVYALMAQSRLLETYTRCNLDADVSAIDSLAVKLCNEIVDALQLKPGDVFCPYVLLLDHFFINEDSMRFVTRYAVCRSNSATVNMEMDCGIDEQLEKNGKA